MLKFLGGVSVIIIIICFTFFFKGNLSNNELFLISILLTLSSIILSWIIAHFYYEKSQEKTIEDIKKDNQSSLKIYASKAAEKVKNLSTELVRLSAYLSEELSSDDYNSTEGNLLAKEERIHSAIHIINTLKSINDGSLSDWKGVIPKEIEEMAEEEREKTERISNLVGEYQKIIDASSEEININKKDKELKKEIKMLNKKIDSTIRNISGIITVPKKRTRKENIERVCPVCGLVLKYKQKPLIKSKKSIICPSCKVALVCEWDERLGFIISKKNLAQFSGLDENLITEVSNRLPPQPWEKGVDKRISSDLKVSRAKVSKAISELIRRGKFKRQNNGEIIF